VLVDKLKSLPNVTIHVNAQTTEVSGDGQKVNGLRYKDRVSGVEQHDLAGVFVQIGLVPNTEFLKGTVELSASARSSSTPSATPACPASLRRGGRDHRALQADHHRHGRRCQGGAQAFDHLIRTPL
jgi:alkyl hydroperoxide reductase subunit F